MFLFLQLVISSFVYAFDCENEKNIEHVLNQVDLKVNSSDLISCKVNPQNKNQLLIAYAVQQSVEKDISVGDYQLYILAVNHQNHRVEYFYPVGKTLISDALYLEEINWDFAPYIVEPNHRVIGLRLKNYGRSIPNPYNIEVLNLYDLDNKKQILDRLIIYQYVEETDMYCNADIEERNSVLVMQPTQTNQYFDIQVKSRIENYEMVGTEEDCIEVNRKKSKHNFILKFDGKQYQIPKQYQQDYKY